MDVGNLCNIVARVELSFDLGSQRFCSPMLIESETCAELDGTVFRLYLLLTPFRLISTIYTDRLSSGQRFVAFWLLFV